MGYQSCIIIMKFLVVASALVAGICAEADPALLYAGYAGYPYALGYGVGLKSAPCVNAANVPVPCAAGDGLVHHYGKREAEADADPALLYGAYAAAVPFGSSTGLDKPMEATEVVATEGTYVEEIQTEMTETVTTEAPQAVKEVPTESAVPESNEAPRREFDDSRIIFSDEAIDNRNKVLATRVFIDDGLLPPITSTENPVPKRSSDSTRIFFPDQDLKG